MPLDDASPVSTLTPPSNLSAEAAVLGAILFDNNAYQRVADILRPTDFYAPAHQELFEVSSNMIQQGRIAELPCVSISRRRKSSTKSVAQDTLSNCSILPPSDLKLATMPG